MTAHLFAIWRPSQITLLWLLLFDLENVIDAKTVATFKGYVLLTSCFQCLHKQLMYHYL